jgi:hypothetical protein
VDLILHEGQQRRNNDSDSSVDHRRHLRLTHHEAQCERVESHQTQHTVNAGNEIAKSRDFCVFYIFCKLFFWVGGVQLIMDGARHLEAKTLASTSRHQHQCALATQCGVYDLPLPWAKADVAKNLSHTSEGGDPRTALTGARSLGTSQEWLLAVRAITLRTFRLTKSGMLMLRSSSVMGAKCGAELAETDAGAACTRGKHRVADESEPTKK